MAFIKTSNGTSLGIVPPPTEDDKKKIAAPVKPVVVAPETK